MRVTGARIAPLTNTGRFEQSRSGISICTAILLILGSVGFDWTAGLLPVYLQFMPPTARKYGITQTRRYSCHRPDWVANGEGGTVNDRLT